MKFSVATIFLSQSLPAWSETPVRAKLSQSASRQRALQSPKVIRAAQEKRLTATQRRLAYHLQGLTKGPRILNANVYCDPTSTDPDIGILSCGDSHMCQASLRSDFGGICVPKRNAKKQSLTGKRIKGLLTKPSRHGRLIDDNDAAANSIPCDPTSSDIGILACGHNNVCKVDKGSALGGFCSSASVTPRRLDTVDICDETSPYFTSDCDCNGLDTTTGTGTVDCLLYDNYPLDNFSAACEGIILALSVSYTFENSVEISYSVCYEMKTPYYQKSCVTVDDSVSDGSCILTLNGEACSSCSTTLDSPIYDCSDVAGGGPGESPLEVIAPIANCAFSSNCTLCAAGDSIAFAYYDINVTIPGIAETTCGYLAVAEYLARIPFDICSVVSEAAQKSCCAYQCDLCGPGAYVPVDNDDIQLNLAIPEYEGFTCGTVANAAYVNFSIPDGSCTTIAGLIKQTCCQAIDDECSLCNGPLTNPYANASIEGYYVQCANLQSFLTVEECPEVSSQVSPVCCSASASSVPGETPTAAPTTPPGTSTTPQEPSESGGDPSEEAETPDAARSIFSEGRLLSSVGGAMMATFLVVALY